MKRILIMITSVILILAMFAPGALAWEYGSSGKTTYKGCPYYYTVEDAHCYDVSYIELYNDLESLIIGHLPAAGHNYKWTVTKEATCQSTGTKKGKCKRCGDTTTKTIEKEDHSYGNWVTTVEPTCYSEGSRDGSCKTCGRQTTQSVKKIDHNYINWHIVESPTCQIKGTRQGTCSMCGGVSNESISTIDHIYNETIIMPAGINSTGERLLNCTMCDKEIRETYYPKGTLQRGDKSKADVEKDTVITVDFIQEALTELGILNGKIDGDYGPATEKAIKVFQEKMGLEVDGIAWQETIETLIIQVIITVVDVDILDVEIGDDLLPPHIVLPPEDDPYWEDEAEEEEEEPVCLKHDYGSWKVTKKASCTAAGSRVRTCKVCGERKTQTLKKLDHNYTNWTVTSQVSDNSKGIRNGECSMCGAEKHEEFYPKGTLYRGVSGQKKAVQECQQMLKDLGYLKDKADGVFGKKTEAAVKAFQVDSGFREDGIAWPETLKLLQENSVNVAPTDTASGKNTHTPAEGPTDVGAMGTVYAYCEAYTDEEGNGAYHYCVRHNGIVSGIETLLLGALTDTDKAIYYSQARSLWEMTIQSMYEECRAGLDEQTAAQLDQTMQELQDYKVELENYWIDQYQNVPFMVDHSMAEFLQERCVKLCKIMYAYEEIESAIDKTEADANAQVMPEATAGAVGSVDSQ